MLLGVLPCKSEGWNRGEKGKKVKESLVCLSIYINRKIPPLPHFQPLLTTDERLFIIYFPLFQKDLCSSRFETVLQAGRGQMSQNSTLRFSLAKRILSLMFLQFLFMFISSLAMLLSLSLNQILISSGLMSPLISQQYLISLAPGGLLQSPVLVFHKM